MILLGYILLGHPDWKKAEIKIYSIIKEGEEGEEENNSSNLTKLVNEGRLPISPHNIIMIDEYMNKLMRHQKTTHGVSNEGDDVGCIQVSMLSRQNRTLLHVMLLSSQTQMIDKYLKKLM